MIVINKDKSVEHVTQGQKLRLLLNKNMRSVNWLAKMLNVSPTAVHKWIKNENKLSTKRIHQIVNVFDVDIEWFN